MGLFSSKPKVGVEEFCRKFYDSYVFRPVIADTDVSSSLSESLLEFVTEADESFATVDKTLLQKEANTLRLELFGLAWQHRLKPDRTIPQVVFTKNYLEENGWLDIWEAITDYSKAIARSPGEIPGGRSRQASNAVIARSRLDFALKWGKAGIDKDSVAYVANRIGTDQAWNRGITASMLTDTLLDRLGRKLNPDGRSRLEAAVVGFYLGAMEAIKSVDLQIRS